ncbi:hypothetical protein [Nocardioides sp. zg-DK7169]|uniref:hypothetical protein n=1 Tax=Nocardioides sp. zg-DK7169 TaxID=2736600 RepID=UPI00155744D5|nr:hypothetical protein [Nocardioides sp. zg-DK7169]NPC97273.1 hypothetical protein [Nocardioides sp. zg-DK7169]
MTFSDGRVLGNNGDHLMNRIFRRVLEEDLQIAITSTPQNADLVVVPPNGALVETYAFPRLLKDRLIGTERLPLVIFPSSAYFPNVDPTAMFGDRDSETVWILREKHSLDHLVDRWGDVLDSAEVSLILDHDIVASGNQHVTDILGPPLTGGGLLVAAREDREATPAALDSSPASAATSRAFARLKQSVPQGAIYTAVARASRRERRAHAAETLMRDVPSSIRGESEEHSRRTTIDLSAPQYATFKRYRRILQSADMVVTNRLHVALPAVIMGKRVILVEAGYHKLQGVYEQSLRGMSNLLFVPRKP